VDALSYLICLLVGVALPVGAFYVGVRRAWRQLSAAEAYREVSRALGLRVDTRGVSVHGQVRGRRLWIGQVMTGYGAERDTEIRGVLALTRPLGLALHMRRRGARGRFRRRSPELEIGDVELDKRYEIHGDDLGRVRALLSDSAVRAAIHSLIERWPQVVLTDHGVRVGLKRPETSGPALEELIARLEQVAMALEASRQHIAPPPALEDVGHNWSELADRLGLDFEAHLPAVSGEVDGRRTLLAVRRMHDGYGISIRAWFHPHPELGLILKPQAGPDDYSSVGQDIQVADASFDASFVIKGWDPRIVRERLSEPVRAGLLELTTLGDVEVNDVAITVRGLDLEHDGVESAVRKVWDIATALGW